jgi:hypothetical protein
VIGLGTVKAALSANAWKLGGLAVVLLVVFSGGVWTGCSRQAAHDEARLAAKDQALTEAAEDLGRSEAQLDAAAATLRRIDADTVTAKAKADADAKANQASVVAARATAAAYHDRVLALEKQLERSKASSPECRRQLEATSCARFE